MEQDKKEKKCLMLIDLQNDFFDCYDGGVLSLSSETMVRNVGRLINFIRKQDDWIVMWVYSIYHEKEAKPVKVDVPGKTMFETIPDV